MVPIVGQGYSLVMALVLSYLSSNSTQGSEGSFKPILLHLSLLDFTRKSKPPSFGTLTIFGGWCHDGVLQVFKMGGCDLTEP